MVYFKENYNTNSNYNFQRFQGVQYFPGGVQLLQDGGVQLLITMETNRTCDFPGGRSGPPVSPPLWICACFKHTKLQLSSP